MLAGAQSHGMPGRLSGPPGCVCRYLANPRRQDACRRAMSGNDEIFADRCRRKRSGLEFIAQVEQSGAKWWAEVFRGVHRGISTLPGQ